MAGAKAAKSGGDPTSPWLFYDGADYLDRHITGTVTFNASNVLTGATVTRQAGCLWTKILIGNDPTNPDRTINVSNLVGTRTFTQAQLNAVNLFNLGDINGLQITASA